MESSTSGCKGMFYSRSNSCRCFCQIGHAYDVVLGHTYVKAQLIRCSRILHKHSDAPGYRQHLWLKGGQFRWPA